MRITSAPPEIYKSNQYIYNLGRVERYTKKNMADTIVSLITMWWEEDMWERPIELTSNQEWKREKTNFDIGPASLGQKLSQARLIGENLEQNH